MQECRSRSKDNMLIRDLLLPSSNDDSFSKGDLSDTWGLRGRGLRIL